MSKLLKSCFKKTESGSKNNESESSVNLLLEEERYKSLLKFKVLLLGAGECGKSTVLKQIKLINKIEFSQEELNLVTVNLKRNSLQSMQTLIDACRDVSPPVEVIDETLLRYMDVVSGYEFEDSTCQLSPEVIESIGILWKSEPIRAVFERRTEFWLLDSVDYYFENLERFCESDFIPEEMDCIMARIITTGIVSTEFVQSPINYQVIDVGGQRNERRKWIHCFDDVTAIIYLVNLNGYCSVLYEDESVMRMHEALDVFEQIVNSSVFSKTPIFLFLNKKDLFQTSLKKNPLTVCFPEYKGTDDVFECIEYVAQQFKEKVTSDKERIKHYNFSARFKRDIKDMWDEVNKELQEIKKMEIKEGLRGLEKVQKIREKGGNNNASSN